MKLKITSQMKFVVLSLLFLLIISCEKDITNDDLKNTEEYHDPTIKRIDFVDFQTKVTSSKSYKKLAKHFDYNKIPKLTEFNSKRIDSSSDIIILTDEILSIKRDDIHFFTFKILAYAPQNKFYNLILQVNEQQEIITSEFIEYLPSAEWEANTSLPFTGEIRLVSNDFFDVDNLIKAKTSRMNDEECYTSLSGVWECDAGNEHSPADCKTDNPNGSCSRCGAEYVITIGTGTCPEYIDAGDSSNGGDGFNGSNDGPSGDGPSASGDDSSGSPTIPTPPCDSGSTGFNGPDDCNVTADNIEKNNLAQRLNSVLNSQQLDWIYSIATIFQVQAINDYLDESTFFNSNKYQSFAIEAIKALMNGGEIDMYNRLVYNPAVAQDYRASMSETERMLFDELNPFIQYQYLKAATQAYIYAENEFPQPVRNRKGDAFKHAYWNALSTVYIGEELTELLTTAHEDITYDSEYPNHYKETQMDLHNNAKGRQIAYGADRIIDLVEEAFDDGDLWYLNNLEFTGIFWKATNSSQLTPTNQ